MRRHSEKRVHMKKLIGLAFIGTLLLSGCLMMSPNREPYGDQGSPNNPAYDNENYGRTMDVSYFYDYLSDYGTWINYPGYTYVWVPYEGGFSWHPFSHGRWVWTEYGWTWVSYYRWGWIPFHYGRWDWSPSLGWFWIPDTIWGPAWVSWRYADDCIGWAPLPPRYRYSRGFGLSLSFIDLPDDCWLFVDSRHFSDNYVERYVLPRYRNGEFVRRTVLKVQLSERGGRIINDGLSLDDVERITRTRVSPYRLRDADRPTMTRIDSDQVVIYRPDVSVKETAQPRKVFSEDDAEHRGLVIRSGGSVKGSEGTTSSEDEAQIQERHKVELRNLERGQQQEIIQTQKQYDHDLARTRSTAEKDQVQKDRDRTVTELKSRHEIEKSSRKKIQADEITGAKVKQVEKKKK